MRQMAAHLLSHLINYLKTEMAKVLLLLPAKSAQDSPSYLSVINE